MFTAPEVRTLCAAWTSIMDEDRGGRPFARERQSVQPFVETRPELLRLLLEDERILRPTEQLLGEVDDSGQCYHPRAPFGSFLYSESLTNDRK
jgi:hypothetical protein